jgi:hypothetical protein
MDQLTLDIQRLIDGRLTDQERTGFLRHLDQEQPEQWRNLALGFIEEQLFQKALGQKSEQLDLVAPPRPTARSSKNKPSLLSRTLPIAAVIALGLTLGTVMWPKPPSSDPVADNPSPKSSLSDYGVVHLGNGESTGMQIPVLNGSTNPEAARQAVLHAKNSLEGLSESYREEGRNPDLKTAYVTRNFNDGSRLVIPVSYLTVQSTDQENESPN